MSYEEHLTRLRDSCSKYLEAANITSFDDLFDCVIKEQFMSTLHPDVRSFVLSKHPATSLDCDKFAQLSFQIKQVHNQGFMRAANTFVERPAFARPAWSLGRQNIFNKLPGNRILLEQIGHPWAVAAQLDQMLINSGEDPVTIRDPLP